MRQLWAVFLTIFIVLAAPPLRAEYLPANDWEPSTLGDTCAAKALPWFSEAEAWAWEQICLDRVAYMQSVGEDDPRRRCHVDPKHASPFGNTLSARFVQVVSTQKAFTEAMPVNFAGFYCASIEGELSLSYSHIPHSLSFYGSSFGDTVYFRMATVDGELSFRQARMPDINLFQAQIKYDLDFVRSRFENIWLQAATVGGDIRLFHAQGLQLKALDAKIGGSIFADGAHLKKFSAERAQIGESIHLRRGRENKEPQRAGLFGAVSLQGADIGDSLQLQGSIYTGPVSLVGTSIRRQLVLIQGGRVPIWYGDTTQRYAPALDLTRAQVGTLRARMPDSFVRPAGDQGAMWETCELVKWSTGAAPGAPIVEEERCVPEETGYAPRGGVPFTAKVIADGVAEYVPLGLGGLRYDAIEDDLVSGQRRASLNPLALAKWAQRESIFKDDEGVDRLGVLRTQPYEQAIGYLERQGERLRANQLRFWKNWHRTKAQFASGWEAPFGLVSLLWLGLTIYGIMPALAFVWFMVLVLWGMNLAKRSAAFEGPPRETRSERFWFSLENALPLLDLSRDYRQIDHKAPGLTQMFHLQKILGFVLASVLVGAIALI